MRLAAGDFDAFYGSRLGEAAVYIMLKRLADLWGDCEGLDVLGMGHAHPLLEAYSRTAHACIAATPHNAAGEHWAATERGISACITDEDRLPFADGAFDRIILLHAMEEADSPRAVLREAWRLLAPEGRLLVAVANRKSLWSLFGNTPFGHGRPWSRRQLIAYLNDHLFQVTASTTAVHLPPVSWGFFASSAEGWEKVGRLVSPGLGGVVMVEALKRLYARPGGGAPAPVTGLAPERKGVAQLPRNEADVHEAKNCNKMRVDR